MKMREIIDLVRNADQGLDQIFENGEDAARKIANGALNGKSVGGLTFSQTETQADELVAYAYEGTVGADIEDDFAGRTIEVEVQMTDGHAALHQEGDRWIWYMYGEWQTEDGHSGELDEAVGFSSDPVSALKKAMLAVEQDITSELAR